MGGFSRCGLGPPAIGALLPFLFCVLGSPAKIDYRKEGTLTLTTLLEDLVEVDVDHLYPGSGFLAGAKSRECEME